MTLGHVARCVKVALKKNLILKGRTWLSTLIECLLPVSLMLLLIWIRLKVTTTYVPGASYLNSPKNNPTWYKGVASQNLHQVTQINPNLTELFLKAPSSCASMTPSGFCPEIFASATWGDRKERQLGAALDGLLPLHMALFNQAIGVIGKGGAPLEDFISSLPGYKGYVKFYPDEESFTDYITDPLYGIVESKPQIFGAIDVKEVATESSPGVFAGNFSFVIRLNATGPGSIDIAGATDVNPSFYPSVSELQEGLSMSNTQIYWSGGLFSSTGVPLQTGGFVDFEALVYAWIYNSTRAFVMPRADDIPKCYCSSATGELVEDFRKCKDIRGQGQLLLLTRLLTPYWSTGLLAGATNMTGCAGRFSSLLPLSVREVPFPTSPHTKDLFATFVKGVFGLFFTLMYIWPLTRIMKNFVEDKENKIDEVMKMMRMPAEAIMLAWYITYGLLWVATSFLMTFVCYNTVFQHSNKLVVWFFFWIFGMCVVTFCALLSVFYARAKIASVVGALLFLMLYFPYSFVSGPGVDRFSKTISCLAPPTALSFGAALIADLESAGVGAGLSTMHLEIDGFTMGRVFFMLIFDTLLFAFLAWYLDKVYVAGFGTRQSCCFFCTRRYWFPESTSGISTEEVQDIERAFNDTAPTNPRFEPVGGALVGQRSVLIRGLTKQFNTADGKVLKAVDDVTINLYSSQIFCLLGHNGAGKSTTINMLSGLLPVSEGDAIVYGKSVVLDMPSIRNTLGVCPQHDVIWSELTVREHLEFFAALKGVDEENIADEVTQIVAEIGMQEKLNALAGTLSGGQKRRLSAAIALIGGSKVVFLDEPSSGVDPFSRRELWDCLVRKKEGRTLILTTHFMDEAERLGDRIAIMAAGQIKCVGSALFLKSQYGVGYTLTIAKTASACTPGSEQSANLKALLHKSCPSSELLSDVGTELSYRMPMSQSRLFPQLFEEFERAPEMYGVEFFSVSVTTLEEVFLRVGEDHAEADMTPSERHQKESFGKTLSFGSQRASGVQEQVTSAGPSASAGRNVASAGPSASGGRNDVQGDDARRPLTEQDNDFSADAAGSGTEVFLRHTHALLSKRYHNSKRDKKAWCCMIALPLVFLLLALMTIKFQGVGSYPVTPLSLAGLPGDQQLVYGAGLNVDRSFVSQFMEGFSTTLTTTMLPNYLDASSFDNDLLENYNRSNGLDRYAALRFNFVPDWSKPTANKSVSGDFTVSGYRYPGGVDAKILAKAFNIPVGTLWNETVTMDIPGLPKGSIPPFPLSELNNRLQVDMFWNSSVRDAVPILYNELNEKLLQTVLKADKRGAIAVKMGNKPFQLTASQKDLTSSTVSLFLALGYAFIPATFGAFVVLERETKSKHLQITCGVNFVSYWLATWIWDCINYLVPAALSVVLISLFGISGLTGPDNLVWTILTLLLFGSYCSSFTYMLSFLFDSHTTAQNIMLVLYLFTGGILEIVSMILAIIPSTSDLMQNTLIYIFRLLPNFCLADALTNLMTRTSPLWVGRGCPLGGCDPWDLKVCGWDLIYMALGSVICFGITLILELGLATPRLRAMFQFSNVNVDTGASTVALDVDVLAEKTRVDGGSADSEMVVVKGLRKVYPGRSGLPPKVAVEDMFFGIPEGECFGYLGMNGAGKTTTMKILTGEDLCTGGGATLGGFDVMTQQNQVRRLIGYCPQFDALIGTLTAREHLMLFARIKGIPKERIRGYVDRMLDRLTLTQFADRQAYTFSGGTKRKLSLGIALVGNPRIVFLDEPTTGVDPESRRFMWKLISTTMQGRSVILTTHSMDECEALCSRIGIMVNGRLVCLGSASHLKGVHGSGYRFEITFKPGVDLKAAFLRLKAFSQERMAGSRCIEGDHAEDAPAEAFGLRVTYKVPKAMMPISAIFREIETAREMLEISEYSISETTLDQIFIHFAKHQWDEVDGLPLGDSLGGSFAVGPPPVPPMHQSTISVKSDVELRRD